MSVWVLVLKGGRPTRERRGEGWVITISEGGFGDGGEMFVTQTGLVDMSPVTGWWLFLLSYNYL